MERYFVQRRARGRKWEQIERREDEARSLVRGRGDLQIAAEKFLGIRPPGEGGKTDVQ